MTTSNNMHTPGPWEYCTGPSLNGRYHTVETKRDKDEDQLMICECYEGTDEQNEANARLMAAAPDMLDALQLVLDTYGFDSSTDSSIWQTVTAAIAKATGEAA